MTPTTWAKRVRSWLAGKLFTLTGKLDPSYDVWLDEAPRRKPGESAELLDAADQGSEDG